MPSLKSNIGNNKFISLDDVCNLLSLTSTQDELGQPIIDGKTILGILFKVVHHKAGI